MVVSSSRNDNTGWLKLSRLVVCGFLREQASLRSFHLVSTVVPIGFNGQTAPASAPAPINDQLIYGTCRGAFSPKQPAISPPHQSLHHQRLCFAIEVNYRFASSLYRSKYAAILRACDHLQDVALHCAKVPAASNSRSSSPTMPTALAHYHHSSCATMPPDNLHRDGLAALPTFPPLDFLFVL